MTRLINSYFIKFTNQELLPWNSRLTIGHTTDAPLLLNECQQDYIDKFKQAIQNNAIKLKEKTKCSCGSNSLEEISNIDRFGLDFSTFICRNCGMIMTSPFIEESFLRYYYETFYHPIHFGKHSIEEQEALFQKGQGRKIYRYVQAFLKDISHLRVLEIGVGTGSVLYEFKNAANEDGLAVEELGTEFSKECIKKAEENGLNVIFGSFEEIIAENRKFDLVILSHVFEHFASPGKELEKLKEVITGKSLVYVEVPGLMTLHKKDEYAFDYLRYTTHAHVNNFNLSSLTHLFNNSGFKLLKGNEEVESVFSLGEQHVHINSNYDNLIHYLSFLEQNRSYMYDKHKILTDKDAQIKEKNVQLRLKDNQLDALEKKKDAEIKQILNSWSWKITGPLRCAATFLLNIKKDSANS